MTSLLLTDWQLQTEKIWHKNQYQTKKKQEGQESKKITAYYWIQFFKVLKFENFAFYSESKDS